MRSEFENDLKNLRVRRARDKSDQDVRLEKVDNELTLQKSEHLKQRVFFGDMAHIISMVTENIAMQMEAESAELIDKQAMALYGLREELPSKIDQFGPQLVAAIEDEKHGKLPGADDVAADDGEIPIRRPKLKVQKMRQALNQASSRQISLGKAEESILANTIA